LKLKHLLFSIKIIGAQLGANITNYINEKLSELE